MSGNSVNNKIWQWSDEYHGFEIGKEDLASANAAELDQDKAASHDGYLSIAEIVRASSSYDEFRGQFVGNIHAPLRDVLKSSFSSLHAQGKLSDILSWAIDRESPDMREMQRLSEHNKFLDLLPLEVIPQMYASAHDMHHFETTILEYLGEMEDPQFIPFFRQVAENKFPGKSMLLDKRLTALMGLSRLHDPSVIQYCQEDFTATNFDWRHMQALRPLIGTNDRARDFIVSALDTPAGDNESRMAFQQKALLESLPPVADEKIQAACLRYVVSGARKMEALKYLQNGVTSHVMTQENLAAQILKMPELSPDSDGQAWDALLRLEFIESGALPDLVSITERVQAGLADGVLDTVMASRTLMRALPDDADVAAFVLSQNCQLPEDKLLSVQDRKQYKIEVIQHAERFYDSSSAVREAMMLAYERGWGLEIVVPVLQSHDALPADEKFISHLAAGTLPLVNHSLNPRFLSLVALYEKSGDDSLRVALMQQLKESVAQGPEEWIYSDEEDLAPLFVGPLTAVDESFWMERLKYYTEASPSYPLDEVSDKAKFCLFVLSFTKKSSCGKAMVEAYQASQNWDSEKRDLELSPACQMRLQKNQPEAYLKILPHATSHMQQASIDWLVDRGGGQVKEVLRIYAQSSHVPLREASLKALVTLGDRETTREVMAQEGDLNNIGAVQDNPELLQSYEIPLGIEEIQQDYSGRGVHVVVVDDGFHPSHTQLRGRVQNRPVGESVITQDHATAVSSMIVGKTVGVAPRAKVEFMQAVVGSTRTEDSLTQLNQTLKDVLEKHARDPALRIVTSSTLPFVDWQEFDLEKLRAHPIYQELRGTLQKLKDAGIFFVVSTGNFGLRGEQSGDWNGMTVLAEFGDLITLVGAANVNGTPDDPRDDYVTDFSSRGGGKTGNPDLVAPGDEVLLARGLRDELGFVPGTSFASPYTAGVLALMLEANPDLSVDEGNAILTLTAQPLVAYADIDQGAGQISPLRAVCLAAMLHDEKSGQEFAEKHDLAPEIWQADLQTFKENFP